MFWDDTTSKDTTTDTCDIFYSVLPIFFAIRAKSGRGFAEILWDLEKLTKMRTWRQIRKLLDDL